MRCSRHPSDHSSSVGVCATCLREHLFSLIAAQARQQAQAEENRRKSDAHHHPPPLIFPRSVSPYICRRSDHSSWSQSQPISQNHSHHHRFYSTPAPTFSTGGDGAQTNRKKHGKFSLISTLFNKSSRSQPPEPDLPISSSRVSGASSMASPISNTSSTSSHRSWFSSLIGRRKKHHQTRFFQDEDITGQQPSLTRQHRRTDRGMSPCDQDENYDTSEPASGYLSEASPAWRKPTPNRRRGAAGTNRNVSGMKFCLSPLVRASPNRQQRCQKDGLPPGMAVSGEIGRGTSKCHLSSAASLCANRSRKLADFGRYNYNP